MPIVSHFTVMSNPLKIAIVGGHGNVCIYLTQENADNKLSLRFLSASLASFPQEPTLKSSPSSVTPNTPKRWHRLAHHH